MRFSKEQIVGSILILLLLFAISVTGLMLTVSYTWMRGYAYEFLAVLHAMTVIVTLLWLPFGKLFHVFQRPAQLGVSFYQDAGARAEAASSRRSATVPLLDISPSVRSHSPTTCPSAVCLAMVPPSPISRSSGCGPKTSRSIDMTPSTLSASGNPPSGSVAQ
jgi:hypothetical protein